MNTMEMKKLYWDLLESVNGGFIHRNGAGQHENIDDKSVDTRVFEDSLQEADDCDFDHCMQYVSANQPHRESLPGNRNCTGRY